MSSERPRVQIGVYSITQDQHEGEKTRATRGWDSGTPVFMSTPYDSTIHSWSIEPLPGIEDLYTIRAAMVPVQNAGDTRNWGLYATDGSVDFLLSSHFSIWKIEYEELSPRTDKKGTPRKTYSRCRIIEAGTNKCWTVDEQGKNIQLAEVTDQSLSERQLFDIFEITRDQPESGKPMVSISTVTPLSVTAVGEDVVRKLYFGTNEISTNIIGSRRYVQLVTDARNLGGADGSEHGESTWFEIAIFSNLPAEGEEVTLQQVKCSPEQNPLIWESHRLPRQNDTSYQKLVGRLPREFRGLWESLEEGDFIGVLACAQYEGSVCDVRGGSLILKE